MISVVAGIIVSVYTERHFFHLQMFRYITIPDPGVSYLPV